MAHSTDWLACPSANTHLGLLRAPGIRAHPHEGQIGALHLGCGDAQVVLLHEMRLQHRQQPVVLGKAQHLAAEAHEERAHATPCTPAQRTRGEARAASAPSIEIVSPPVCGATPVVTRQDCRTCDGHAATCGAPPLPAHPPNGLTVPWSIGPIEGHIHRVKLIKRQGYGRAKLDLRRRRVLAA